MTEDATTEAAPATTEAAPTADANKTFTQDELDRIVGERIGRERSKYADYNDLKAAKTKLEEIEQANQSETEKAAKRAENAERERDQALDRANQTLIRAAITTEAAKQGAVDTDAVVALLPTDAVTVDKDGNVTGAEGAVKALLAAKEFLKGTPFATGGSPANPSRNRDNETTVTPGIGRLRRAYQK